jgi:hypothetical protein
VEKRVEKAVPINAFIDDKPNRPRAGEREHDRIDPGDVVREEKESALGQSFPSGGRNAIGQSREAQTKESQGAFEAGRVRHCLWFTRSGLFRAIVN